MASYSSFLPQKYHRITERVNGTSQVCKYTGGSSNAAREKQNTDTPKQTEKLPAEKKLL
jgi:hypothetical protein